jgi:hypothetical protein
MRVLDGRAAPESNMASGATYRLNPHIQETLAAPILIEIYINGDTVYPFKDRHTPETPLVILNSLEEELVLVISHEMHHVEQLLSWNIPNTEKKIEIEAELFAIKMLEEWRNR